MQKSSKTEVVIHSFEKVMNQYIVNEKRPRYYGTDQLLHRSEVHTIDGIGKHNSINVTALSNYLGITKGAVSQMIDKLIKKGLVNKTVLSKSDTEVALSLTLKGMEVYKGHNEYHYEFYKKIEHELANMSEDDIQIFLNIMDNLNKILKE